ncbi:MAG: hypothetical protein ACK4N5_10615 [Myxococcales bacterium]
MSRIRMMLLCCLVALPLSTGCQASCEDMCESLAECGKKLDPNQSSTDADIQSCVKSCENELKTACGDQHDEFRECIADMKCENQQSAFSEIFGCFGECPGLFSSNPQ